MAFETQILLLILHISTFHFHFPIVYLPNLVRSVEVTDAVSVGCEKIFDITGKFDEEN